MKITGKTPAAGSTKDVKIAEPLKYLLNNNKYQKEKKNTNMFFSKIFRELLFTFSTNNEYN